MKRAGLLIAVAGLAAAVGWWALDQRRSDEIRRTPIGPETIVMLGDSITAGTDWQARFPDRSVANEGYPGFTTSQLVTVAREVAALRPGLVFVLVGTNDVRDGLNPEVTVSGLAEILDVFEQRSPGSRVVVQTILPRAATADAIVATNAAIAQFASERDVELIDLHARFDDGTGGLRSAETTDGWHLSDRGYDRWADVLDAWIDADAPA